MLNLMTKQSSLTLPDGTVYTFNADATRSARGGSRGRGGARGRGAHRGRAPYQEEKLPYLWRGGPPDGQLPYQPRRGRPACVFPPSLAGQTLGFSTPLLARAATTPDRQEADAVARRAAAAAAADAAEAARAHATIRRLKKKASLANNDGKQDGGKKGKEGEEDSEGENRMDGVEKH
ncbi:hypothetical protein B0A50_07416 [Salinomyces thailandicus]|uniref:Uncharacterized protein n=1 Tax=Salinomyces thailandicus TaxID=706561 RepID=A0A4V5N3C6_9PEZI|nr:hypothetical protein B0A50_07416 [Salinomyces thailandica]